MLSFLFEVVVEFVVEFALDGIVAKERTEAKRNGVEPARGAHGLGLLELDDAGDGGGEAAPVGGFTFELAAAEACERIKLGAAVVFAGAPLSLDPALLFELVEGGIE